MEYLLVDPEGKILATFQSGAEVARALAQLEKESQSASVVLHDEHDGELISTESFVTARPLSER